MNDLSSFETIHMERRGFIKDCSARGGAMRVERAPANKAQTNPLIGQQLTGVSTAVRAFWTPLRQAGAAGRELLIRAAAQTWKVKEDECRAENGVVLHKTGKHKATYGEPAAKAATLTVPSELFLKEPGD